MKKIIIFLCVIIIMFASCARNSINDIDESIPNSKIENEQKVPESDISDYKPDHSNKEQNQYSYATLTYNGIEYYWFKNFPIGTKFEDIDFNDFKTKTGETVTVICSTDDKSYTQTCELYELPDFIENDSDVDILVTDVEGIGHAVFFSEKKAQDGDTIYDLFSRYERLYKSKRTSFTDVLSITIVDCNNPDITHTVNDIKEFYERISKFEYMSNTSSLAVGRENEHQGLYQITLEFKDGSNLMFTFERIRRVMNNYVTDNEFEDYLCSFID